MRHALSIPVVFFLVLLTFGATGVRLAAQPGPGASPEIDPTTLQSMLSTTVSLFAAGDVATAATYFDTLEERFGKEDEYRADNVQKVLLPIKGYSYSAVGRNDEAASVFEEYLNKYADDRRRRALVLFTLAKVYTAIDEDKKAIGSYERFISEFPERSEAAIAAIRRAELLFDTGESDKAFTALDNFYKSQAPFTLREQARLRQLQEASKNDRTDLARQILLDTPWQISGMPELAVLTFEAIRIADGLLAEQDAARAIQAYRLVPPRDRLIAAQESRLAEIQEAYRQRRDMVQEMGGSVWDDYYRKLIARVNAQLEALKTGADYTPSVYLRFGQALLLAGRHHEAWILYETLSLADDTPSEIREQAYYRWILAAQGLEDWAASLTIAKAFQQEYPDASTIPMALYLIGVAHQELREFDVAVEVLTNLLENYPEHPHASYWLFTRGFNNLLGDQFVDARADFSVYRETYPDGRLLENARLWHAMAWFYEKSYPQALTEFDALKKQLRAHPLTPEVHYQRAATLYSMRDYEPALAQIEEYLKAFRGHLRTPEANVLKGDILMGIGKLVEARTIFAQVTPEAESLFPYAVFQVGKILKALEEYELMIRHFTGYIERDDIDPKPRMSEAIYWIAYALEQLDRTAEAFPVYLEALSQYGNDPKAAETQLILQALEKLHRRFVRDSSEDALENLLAEVDTEKGRRILKALEFADWAESERSRAFAGSEKTYFIRLSLYLASRYERARNPDLAQTTLLEVSNRVDIEDMDAAALGRIGTVLLDLELSTAAAYFERLLSEFPDSQHRAFAYMGLGKLSMDKESFAEAADKLGLVAEELPLHPIAPEAALLHGKALTELGRYDEAREVYDDILRQKVYRGRIHARALMGLARMNVRRENFEEAFAYYQRIYTLYRAYDGYLEEAYLQSAMILEEHEKDLVQAMQTYEEMAATDKLSADVRAKATAEAERLRGLIPAAKLRELESKADDGEVLSDV